MQWIANNDGCNANITWLLANYIAILRSRLMCLTIKFVELEIIVLTAYFLQSMPYSTMTKDMILKLTSFLMFVIPASNESSKAADASNSYAELSLKACLTCTQTEIIKRPMLFGFLYYSKPIGPAKSNILVTI